MIISLIKKKLYAKWINQNISEYPNAIHEENNELGAVRKTFNGFNNEVDILNINRKVFDIFLLLILLDSPDYSESLIKRMK